MPTILRVEFTRDTTDDLELAKRLVPTDLAMGLWQQFAIEITSTSPAPFRLLPGLRFIGLDDDEADA